MFRYQESSHQCELYGEPTPTTTVPWEQEIATELVDPNDGVLLIELILTPIPNGGGGPSGGGGGRGKN